ncbi:MAG: hypothetical protein DRJ10_01925 [Bacteroidetes bacterium]|nr:MAG: hypothetical protein DRI74_08915 [Bacteroidota bacterium]RLD84167.1 MAG: hypothetical protein DRJ10_01925 [Bacteroidota bacterium]
MKIMKIEKLLLSLIIIFLCGLPTNSQQLSDSSTFYSDERCDICINHFNQKLTQSILDEIDKVKNGNNWSTELDTLYPYARDAWNNAIYLVKQNFDNNDWANGRYQALDFSQFENWKDDPSLKNYQKFFLLLTEATLGPYPDKSLDMSEQIAWMEHADVVFKLDQFIETCFTNICEDTESAQIRRSLNPKKLPDNP